MGKGDTYAAEWSDGTDRVTGVRVRQLTDHRGHSTHLYFTNSGWFDGGDRLLFGSDRYNRFNLHSVDLRDGTVRQLTDSEPRPTARPANAHQVSVNPHREEAYFWHGDDLVRLDLRTLDEDVVHTVSAGYLPGGTSVTADGGRVCFPVNEDTSLRPGGRAVPLPRRFTGVEEYHDARPHSQVVAVDLATGKAEVLHEEAYWVTHVNTSPTQPHLLTFSHEGPWYAVDNRIWLLDTRTAAPAVVRPRTGKELVGHEFWLEDGVRIGYHGNHDERNRFFGVVDVNGAVEFEIPHRHRSVHFHSDDGVTFVGDGQRTDPHLYLWRRTGDGFDGPRTLLRHGCSFVTGLIHPHPRFTADGSQIVFTSDVTGYANVYLADLPEETSGLPARSEA